MDAKKGDSGGVVFDTSTKKIVGILNASNSTESLISKAVSINQSFGLSMYIS